jgi:hypothetical protein
MATVVLRRGATFRLENGRLILEVRLPFAWIRGTGLMGGRDGLPFPRAKMVACSAHLCQTGTVLSELIRALPNDYVAETCSPLTAPRAAPWLR